MMYMSPMSAAIIVLVVIAAIFLLLGGAFSFYYLTPLFLIIGLLWLFALQSRIKRLEQRIAAGARGSESAAPPSVEPAGPQPAAVPAEPAAETELPAVPVAAQSTDGDVESRLIAWFKEETLMKVGALLILLGFGWFVTYAFMNNWIGPVGRIALGLVAGAALLGIGWWRFRAFMVQGSVLVALGATVIHLTVYAARMIYDFWTPTVALGVMFAAAAYVALASVVYRNKRLAVWGLALAGVAPLLAHAPTADFVGLFSYLMIIVVGTLWIIRVTGWRELIVAALALIAAYSPPAMFGADAKIILVFIYAFAAIFFTTGIFAILRSAGRGVQADVYVAAGNGVLLLAWILTVAEREWQSLIIVAWLLAFLAAAFTVFRATRATTPFYAYAGVGVAMIAAATARELNGSALTIAYLIESAVVSFAIYAVLRDVRIVGRSLLLLIGPGILSMQNISSPAWAHSIWHEDAATLLLISLVLFGLGSFFRHRIREYHLLGADPVARYDIALTIIGSVYACIIVWLSFNALYQPDTAVMLALIVYTLLGLATYVYGRMAMHEVIRQYGAVVLMLVIIRLLLIDVWNMALTWRIITFFIIGALLIASAFIGRNRGQVGPSEPSETEGQS
jgi:uncharacterized membrane protein